MSLMLFQKRMNRTTFTYLVLLFSIFYLDVHAKDLKPTAVIFKSGISNQKFSNDWVKAVESRMTRQRLDSLSSISRELTDEEKAWQELIFSKAEKWNSMRDSLLVPFSGIAIPDTIFVMVGFLWKDDGFTYKLNTVCLDATALFQNYGPASVPENDTRIDRLFAHEFTHVIHKNWVKKNNITIKSFRDSILWECLYEGIGMYRSLTSKWFPKNNILPEISQNALNDLYPIMKARLAKINSKKKFTNKEKEDINANLSRGPVNKKWGAFPVAIWLSLEASGNDKNLIQWIEKGPEAITMLAEKYLD